MTASTLTESQQRAAEMLAVGGDPGSAAVAVGVSARTLRRWRAMPEFAEAIGTAAADTFAEARTAVLGAAVAAATTARAQSN
ncbi:hypothetical protein EU513_03520 [Yimella sp. RIT 621]|uniref:hypothetical protein n=1 Tax=Yimella sp. RIT 621 TaxID=2510323 RepID=UPI00101DAAFE|nr:hypothetical protein [Yimella sp. RIT 621]RYG78144.1 hypothetical protein EU513_03520 [Yimella sp. RIT 621]